MTYNHVVSNILRAFSDDGVYEELDDILAELDEDIYRIIDCPVCGEKTLDFEEIKDYDKASQYILKARNLLTSNDYDEDSLEVLQLDEKLKILNKLS